MPFDDLTDQELYELTMRTLRKIERLKAQYKTLDLLTEAFKSRRLTQHKIDAHHRLVLKDTFKTKNVAFHATPCRRFYLEVETTDTSRRKGRGPRKNKLDS